LTYLFEIYTFRQSDLSVTMSSSDVSYPSTPPHIRESARNVTLNLLPQKSKTRYEKEYSVFIKWCLANKAGSSYSENIVLTYLAEIGKSKKSSTLWSIYSMLRTTLLIKHDIDISKYTKVIAFLKRQSVGYKAKKSEIFKREEINKFLLEAPDDRYLMIKVICSTLYTRYFTKRHFNYF